MASSLNGTGVTFSDGSTQSYGTSGNFQFNSGYGSSATAYGCRAWVNFDGTSGSIGAGNGSGNISSVTDNGTGNYTLNFSSAMPDTNYSASGVGRWNADTNTHSCTIQQRLSSVKSTTAFEIWVINGVNGSSFAAFDSPNISVQIFR